MDGIEQEQRKMVSPDSLTKLLLVSGTLFAVANGMIPSLATMIYGGLTNEFLGTNLLLLSCLHDNTTFQFSVPSTGLNTTSTASYTVILDSNSTEIIEVMFNSLVVGIKRINRTAFVLENGFAMGPENVSNETILFKTNFTREMQSASKANKVSPEEENQAIKEELNKTNFGMEENETGNENATAKMKSVPSNSNGSSTSNIDIESANETANEKAKSIQQAELQNGNNTETGNVSTPATGEVETAQAHEKNENVGKNTTNGNMSLEEQNNETRTASEKIKKARQWNILIAGKVPKKKEGNEPDIIVQNIAKLSSPKRKKENKTDDAVDEETQSNSLLWENQIVERTSNARIRRSRSSVDLPPDGDRVPAPIRPAEKRNRETVPSSGNKARRTVNENFIKQKDSKNQTRTSSIFTIVNGDLLEVIRKWWKNKHIVAGDVLGKKMQSEARRQAHSSPGKRFSVFNSDVQGLVSTIKGESLLEVIQKWWAKKRSPRRIGLAIKTSPKQSRTTLAAERNNSLHRKGPGFVGKIEGESLLEVVQKWWGNVRAFPKVRLAMKRDSLDGTRVTKAMRDIEGGSPQVIPPASHEKLSSARDEKIRRDAKFRLESVIWDDKRTGDRAEMTLTPDSPLFKPNGHTRHAVVEVSDKQSIGLQGETFELEDPLDAMYDLSDMANTTTQGNTSKVNNITNRHVANTNTTSMNSNITEMVLPVKNTTFQSIVKNITNTTKGNVTNTNVSANVSSAFQRSIGNATQGGNNNMTVTQSLKPAMKSSVVIRINFNGTTVEMQNNSGLRYGGPIGNLTLTLRNSSLICEKDISEPGEKMKRFVYYYLYAALATLFCACGQMICWNMASERGARDISDQLTLSMVENAVPGWKNPSILDSPGVSALDIASLRGGVGGAIAYIIQSITSCSSGYLVGLGHDWKLTLVMMAAAPAMGVIATVVVQVEKYVKKQKKVIENSVSSVAGKGLQSVTSSVAVFAGQFIDSDRFESQLKQSSRYNQLKSLVKGFGSGLGTLILFLFLGLAVWYSTTHLDDGTLSPGALLTVFMAIIGGTMQVGSAYEQIDDASETQRSLSALLGISTIKDAPIGTLSKDISKPDDVMEFSDKYSEGCSAHKESVLQDTGSQGERSKGDSFVAKVWTMLLRRKQAFHESFKRQIESLKMRWRLLKIELQDAPFLLAAALGAVLTGLTAPGISALFTQIQKSLGDYSAVSGKGPYLMSMFVLLGALVAFGGTIEKYMSSLATGRLQLRLKKRVYERTKQRKISAETSAKQLEQDLQTAVQASIGKCIGPDVQSYVSLLTTFYLAFCISWKMALVASAGYPIIVLAHLIQQKQIDEGLEPTGNSEGGAKFRGLPGAQEKLINAIKEENIERYNRVCKRTLASGVAFAVGQAMVFAIFAGTLRYGCHLVQTGEISLGDVLSVLMAIFFAAYANTGSLGPTLATKDSHDAVQRLFYTRAAPESGLGSSK